jgi:hypothetical protein
MDKERKIRKISTKGNTREKIQREGHKQKKNNEDGKIIQMGMSRAKTRKEERKRLQRE